MAGEIELRIRRGKPGKVTAMINNSHSPAKPSPTPELGRDRDRWWPRISLNPGKDLRSFVTGRDAMGLQKRRDFQAIREMGVRGGEREGLYTKK